MNDKNTKEHTLTDEQIKRNRIAALEPLAAKCKIPAGLLVELPRKSIAAISTDVRQWEAIAYYAANPEAAKEYHRRYRETNRETINARQNQRRAEVRRKRSEDGTHV